MENPAPRAWYAEVYVHSVLLDSLEATAVNLDKLIGRTVFVVERDTDRYGRLVGTLYTPEGVNVNLEMVCNGSAWWYSRYAKGNRAMASCQREAKEAELGLWADDDPMPPWEWRKR